MLNSSVYFEQELMRSFVKFRQELRQLLADNGVASNPGWTEDDIVNAFRQLLRLKDASIALYDVRLREAQERLFRFDPTLRGPW